MIYNPTESSFASFSGSFFTGHTTAFPFTCFPFLFLILQRQSKEILSTWLPPFGTLCFPPSPSHSPLIKKGAHSHQGGLSERWRNGKEDDDRICWDIKGSPGIWLPIIESNKALREKKINTQMSNFQTDIKEGLVAQQPRAGAPVRAQEQRKFTAVPVPQLQGI